MATFAMPKGEDDEFLNRIDEAIENDADGLGGVQKYVLVALASGRAISRLPLRVASTVDEPAGFESLESEPANAKGLLSQLMRHNEIQSRMFAMSMGQVITTMQRTIVRLQETGEQADDRRLAAVDVAEQMLTRNHERAALTQMVEDNRAAKTAMFDTVKGAMPYLLHYLKKGSGMSKQDDTPVGKLVGQLASSLGPEQLLSLEKVLTDDQMEIVGKILAAQAPAEADGTEAKEAQE